MLEICPYIGKENIGAVQWDKLGPLDLINPRRMSLNANEEKVAVIKLGC